MTFSRKRRIVCNLIAATIGLALSIFLLLLLDRRHVVELDASRSVITPNPARAGDRISITWSAISRRNCAGFVVPRVIESTGRIFEYARTTTVYHDLMRDGARSFTKELTLPTVMAPGHARYEAVVVRWCNPVQQYIWPMTDRPFPIPFTVAP